MTLTTNMDTCIGLEYIVENREYVAKLGSVLDTNNTTVKKQVFELLSALCAYSADGYARALETIEHYKNLKGNRYRLKVVVIELEKSTDTEYQSAILAFINCIIISAPDLKERIRIRNEFIGLNLLPVLSNLRRVSGKVADIAVQLDVFDEQRECDEAQSLHGPDGINLNSHLDVFYAILRQVADTPQEIPFLSILQHLLRIDPKEAISDIIWDTTETLVHRATLLETREDSTRLLRAPSVQKFTCPHCRGETSSPSRKQSLAQTQPIITSLSATNIPAAPAPPPPPPPPCIPPPPPPMAGGSFPPAPPAPPPPAPSLPSSSNELMPNSTTSRFNRPITPEPLVDPAKLLPQQETPVPKTKMKTINWNKIPPNKVVGKYNIWTVVADSHQNSPMADLDWNEMEGLFCQQATGNSQGSPKLGRDAADSVERKPRKENSEIILLDGKRSLNVNIFLKQFRTSNEDIIKLIKNGEHDDIGAEKLRGFLKILPEVDELDMLKSFDGDKCRLGNAEKFLLQLLQVSDYKLRIEGMLLKEEFAANMSYLEPCINAMLFAGEDLTTNTHLRDVLYMIVVAGNFLNAGGYAGNAIGVKLSSLQKLTDIRANKPGMNLIHFVALQAEKRNRDLLTFPNKLLTLENASKTTVDQINNEITTLDTRIKKIRKQIEMPSTGKDIKEQMTEFLQVAEREVAMLQRGMKEVDALRIQLAEFFCEDPGSFKLEECFKIFHNFCEKFKQAVNENERRRIQEEQATLRRKQREEQLAKRAKQTSQAGTPVSDSDNSIMLDPSQYDIRGSPAMPRRRIGSFNSHNADATIHRDDTASPDITPTGSLRRRRSRVLSEEDDGSLMDFLRSSGHDNGSRERKPSSYGSLDRSWARRARTGSGCKKRPDLLNIDFGEDRERPASPSPHAESKPLPADESKPRISREWRQKIESWLQANEQDEKQNEDYKRRARRLAGNRKSFENDSESERSKLDPLPEEKSTTADTYKRVYPEWKPSAAIEKTDVVKTIEAIEDAQTPRSKDKSAWRKSSLNTSSEDSESYSRRLLRQRSRDGATPSPINSPLQSIIEEDRRKSVIQQLGERSASDRLQIYIRRPSDSPEQSDIKSIDKPISSSPIITSDHHSIYIRPDNSTGSPQDQSTSTIVRPTKNCDDLTNNKIEIDSDNIETPPTTRRNITLDSKVLASPCRKLQTPRPLHKTPDALNPRLEPFESRDNDIDVEIGEFDRHSSTRRTRRYKRPTDYSGDEKSPKSDSQQTESKQSPISEPKTETNKTSDDSDSRLKRWQDKLKRLDDGQDLSQNTISDIMARVGKVGRNLSTINQEDVREAIRNLKSPTETPERVWSPPREIIPKEKERISLQKSSNHELNDEGFEETQSLVSDTPSHGKESTSSCNDQPEQKSKKPARAQRMTSSDSAATTSSETSKKRIMTRPYVQSLLERNRQSLERSRSLRATGSQSLTASVPRTVLPKRTSSLRKTDSNSSVPSTCAANKRCVERSSSRTSLRSSRSSLNSSASANTVKHVGVKPATVSPEKSGAISNRKPFGANSSATTTTLASRSTTRTPASRSSSSGSSIGPSVRKPLPRNSFNSGTSNSNGITASSYHLPSRISSVQSRLQPPANNISSMAAKVTARLSNTIPASHTKILKNNTNNNNNNGNNASMDGNKIHRVSNFMRPTTASATKFSGPKGK